MQFKKAWKGYWVSFDPAAAPAGDGKSGWAFVKKEGAQWKYWNEAATPAAWADLPRAVGSYTLNGMFFVFDGTHYMQRGGSAQWPEAFPDSPDFASRKTHWLGKIHETWDGRFQLHRKLCPSTDHKCCTWPIKIRGEWAEDAGDKLVYGIWTQAYQNERSNASDWYLGDQRDGLGPHEFGHLLGAYDEYTGGALDPTGGTGGTPGPIEPNCIMGQNLPLTAKERHLNNWRDEVKKKINAWTSHTWDFEVKPR